MVPLLSVQAPLAVCISENNIKRGRSRAKGVRTLDLKRDLFYSEKRTRNVTVLPNFLFSFLIYSSGIGGDNANGLTSSSWRCNLLWIYIFFFRFSPANKLSRSPRTACKLCKNRFEVWENVFTRKSVRYSIRDANTEFDSAVIRTSVYFEFPRIFDGFESLILKLKFGKSNALSRKSASTDPNICARNRKTTKR